MNNSKKNIAVRGTAKSWIHKHPKIYAIYKQGIFRYLSSSFRILPDFLIIGAVKSGTSSLYDYIILHPEIFSALRKETKFFDVDFKLGINMYKSNFPTPLYRFIVRKLQKKKFLTGEATPGYIHNPHCAKRVHDYLPNVKLIIILRNPIDRAYSDYQMRIRAKHETKSFEDSIKEEEKKLSESEKILENENYSQYGAEFRPYLSRGNYYEQIKPWRELFPKENFLILKTEDLEKDHQKTLNHVFKFLGLKEMEISDFTRKNVAKYAEMNLETRKHLIEHFKPQNEKLKELNLDVDWNH